MSEEPEPVEQLEDELPGDGSVFEQIGHDNGSRYWWRSDLMGLLGYANLASFNKAVAKAISACTALGIPFEENFAHTERVGDDGETFQDCKLSRFACYLTAMNSDPRKPEVAQAQAYFATMAEVARQYFLHSENMERVLIRDEVASSEKALTATAHGAGVVHYAYFQNAGYRGLYNLNLRELLSRKKIPEGRTLLDFMGKEELAANLFRITQTEAKIRKDSVRGQGDLERTAERVGREVRETIQRVGGTMPERLATSEDIKDVRKGLKATSREFRRLDKPKKKLPPL